MISTKCRYKDTVIVPLVVDGDVGAAVGAAVGASVGLGVVVVVVVVISSGQQTPIYLGCKESN